jgi:hypothetical protein
LNATVKTKAALQAVPEAKEARKPPELKVGDLKFAEYTQNDRTGVAPSGSLPEDFDGQPGPWALMNDLKPYDLIRLVSKDASWWALYLCIDSEVGYVNCVLLQKTTLPQRRHTIGGGLPAGYEVRPGDPGEAPWLVVRQSDGWVMNAGQSHRDYETAVRWLKDLAIFRSDTPRTY